MNVNATTARGQWAAFEQILASQGAAGRDLALARLCFYAGMEGMQRINIAISDMSEREAIATLAGVSAELVTFGKALAQQLGGLGGGNVQ